MYIDGGFEGTVAASTTGVHNERGQLLFNMRASLLGRHTLKLVKHSGKYMRMDAFDGLYPDRRAAKRATVIAYPLSAEFPASRVGSPTRQMSSRRQAWWVYHRPYKRDTMPLLNSAAIGFHTLDEDKDGDTPVEVTISPLASGIGFVARRRISNLILGLGLRFGWENFVLIWRRRCSRRT